MAECRSCHAEIRWVNSAATGKLMPVDAEPSPIGNIILEGDRATVLAGRRLATARHVGWTLYLSHFASCEQAGEWRTRDG